MANHLPSDAQMASTRVPAASANPAQTISFNPFIGLIFTTLLAGLALKVVSSFVNGLIPLRSGVAGLWTTLIFIRPGIVPTPGPLRFDQLGKLVEDTSHLLLGEARAVRQGGKNLRFGHWFLGCIGHVGSRRKEHSEVDLFTLVDVKVSLNVNAIWNRDRCSRPASSGFRCRRPYSAATPPPTKTAAQ